MVTMVASAVNAPAFVLDDINVLLIVGIALVSGAGAATLAALVVVAADDVLALPLQGRLPLTLLENLLDLSLLIGIAVLMNRLIERARQAQSVAELTAERERHVRQERERVVATVAHDLATPLTVVRGTVQTAKRVGLGHDTNDNRLLSRIETAAARASSLVKTLTDLKDSGGARPDQVRLVDLREILRTVVDMMDQVSERHPMVLRLPDRRIPIEADSERLHRVFENILNNAIKYSPAGGEIDVSVQLQDLRASVSIRDHGIGITPEARQRVFDLSYRAPEALTASPGRGLGLYIAAQIVAAHAGTIVVRGARGGGTEIVVGLRVADRVS